MISDNEQLKFYENLTVRFETKYVNAHIKSNDEVHSN